MTKVLRGLMALSSVVVFGLSLWILHRALHEFSLVEVLAPGVYAAMALLGGAVLLWSSATPAVPVRLEFLQSLLPLPVVEASHLLGSIAGLWLLLLARGLYRRLDGAYWLAGGKEEIAIDLMRHRQESGYGVMDYLFIEAMLWGQAQGYRWFSFGVAPLSGMRDNALVPLWNRLGAFLYRHGEDLYNFQGLRRYKEKFAPRWEPRYMASPGGMVLPRITADVAALISGGMKGLVMK